MPVAVASYDFSSPYELFAVRGRLRSINRRLIDRWLVSLNKAHRWKTHGYHGACVHPASSPDYLDDALKRRRFIVINLL